MFKSLIHFETICVYGELKWSSFILLNGPVLPTPLIKETVLFPLYILASFVID